MLVVHFGNMLGLAARTGRQFLGFKNLYMIHNLRHASNIQTFQDIFSRKGQGSAVVSHKTPYIICRTFGSKQDLKVLTEIDKDVADLEIIVKKRAWLCFEANRRSEVISKPGAELKLDWSDVKFIPDLPKYKKITDDTITESMFSKVAFAVGNCTSGFDEKDVNDEVLYYNGTSTEQIHKIRTERKTASSYQTTMEKGYTNSSHFQLTMKAPTEILKLAYEFSDGLTLTKGVNDSKENIITRVTEEHIKVPSKSGIKVKTKAYQKEAEYTFETLVSVEGFVTATFYDKNGNELSVILINMQFLICEEIPEAVEDGDKYKINYKGKCGFTYGMLQGIEVTEISEHEWFVEAKRE